MNQTKTGQFICQLRKDKGMTQKELAEIVGVSDKAISKWETGKGMPDIALFDPLCEALGISVNELISGESISLEERSEKMEETIMELVKENQKNNSKWISIIIGIVLILLGIVALVICTTGWQGFLLAENFLDIPSIIFLVIFAFGSAFASGAKGVKEFVSIIRKIIIPIGAIITLFSVVVILRTLSNVALIGPNVAVGVMTLLYACIIYIVLTLVENRMNVKA